MMFLSMGAAAIFTGVHGAQPSGAEKVLVKGENVESATIVTKHDLADLPAPVQRWLTSAGIVGKPAIKTVRLKQEGFFRREPKGKWMPFTAEQYYSTEPPSFLWKAKIKAAPLFTMSVRDSYQNGHGGMQVKLFSLIPVGSSEGPELDQGTLLRYLNETMWFPSAALSDYITWEAIDGTSARATMEYQGVKASAVFYINKSGDVTNMTADRYYSEPDGGFRLEPWSTPITGYKEFHGIRIPAEGTGVWNLEEGDFSYIRLKIVDIDYNITEPY